MDPAKQKLSKSIATSVPSIAIRFHCGDEDVDIYPSADDEEDEDTPTEGHAPAAAPAAQLTPSRDSSPIKEYFKGLGRRSTSVDSSMDSPPPPPAPAPAGGGSDTWRIFHELRGKITKTVEEKLTEMKADRRAASAASSPSKARLRGGADRSSVSESDDGLEKTGADAEGADETKGKQGKKSRKLNKSEKKRKNKGGGATTSSEGSDADFVAGTVQEVEVGVEAGVEAEEKPRLRYLRADLEADTTIDYRAVPARMRLGTKRMSHVFRPHAPESAVSRASRRAWQARWMIAAGVALIAYVCFPLGTFANGVIVGVFITVAAHFSVGLSGLMEPVPPRQFQPFQMPDFTRQPILRTPGDWSDTQLTTSKCAGWMNELPYDYDPETYHINNTQTVYVRLDGSTLRISHPRNKVPKRASYNEREYKMKFVHQRIYDLAGCQLKLLPEGLTRRRIWSRKYPLCLVLPCEAAFSEETLPEPATADADADVDVDLPLADPPVYPRAVSFTSRRSVSRLRSTASEGLPFAGWQSQAVVASGLDEPVPVESVAVQTSLEDCDSKPHITFDPAAVPKVEVAAEKKPAEYVDENDFFVVDEMPEFCLYLFARADRQKEDWYRRITMAIRSASTDPAGTVHLAESGTSMASTATNATVASTARRESPVICPDMEFSYRVEEPGSSELVTGRAADVAAAAYLEFMARFPVQVKPYVGTTVPRVFVYTIPSMCEKGLPKLVEREVDCDVLWFNAMLGHVLYDLLASPTIADMVQAKIQKKLDLIKLPYYIDNLVLSHIDLGRNVPYFHRASRPVVNDHGLWVDLDVTFEGCVRLTIETKLNLMKLKKKKDTEEDEEGDEEDVVSVASPPAQLAEEGEDADDDLVSMLEGFEEEGGDEFIELARKSIVMDRPSSSDQQSTEQSTPSATPSVSKASTASPSGSKASTATPSGPKAAGATPTGSKTSTASPSGSKAAGATPSGSQASAASPSGSKSVGATPSGSKTSAALSSGSKTGTASRSGSKTGTASRSGSKTSAGRGSLTEAMKQQSAIYNSDVEDSAESSETETDTKSAPTSSGESGGTKSTEASPSRGVAPGSSRAVMRMMHRIVESKYFQQATEYKYIKRAMQGVSNTVITLTVELTALSGQLALNMPPPPSDRIWYGFRGNPGIWLKARPKFGDRSVSMRRLVSFIEKKLVQEMEKKFVLPNMDDLVIPPMTTELP